MNYDHHVGGGDDPAAVAVIKREQHVSNHVRTEGTVPADRDAKVAQRGDDKRDVHALHHRRHSRRRVRQRRLDLERDVVAACFFLVFALFVFYVSGECL